MEIKVAKKTKVIDVLKSDVAYVTLMNNKELIHDITLFLIQEAVKEGNCLQGDYTFGGSFMIGEEIKEEVDSQDLTPLIDQYTVDLVSRFIPNKKAVDYKTQATYKTTAMWLRDHAPVKNKSTIYFIGQPHRDEEHENHLDVHWNCFIVDQKRNEIIWYDPSESTIGNLGYNFDLSLKLHVTNLLKMANPRLKGYTALTMHRAQQSCHPSRPAVDVFCQSWVLFFASSWVNNCFPSLVFMGFDRSQYYPLKIWLNCVISRLGEWHNTFQRKQYGLFQKFCRFGTADGNCVVLHLPNLEKQNCPEKPCIYSIITFVHELPECYRQGVPYPYLDNVPAYKHKWFIRYDEIPILPLAQVPQQNERQLARRQFLREQIPPNRRRTAVASIEPPAPATRSLRRRVSPE